MKKTNRIKIYFAVLSLTLLFGAFDIADAQRRRTRPAQTAQTTAATPQPTAAAPEINFTVGMSKPWTHLLEVEMRLRGNLGQQTEIVMPVWTPGSYLIREYARHVMDFAAKDAAGNNLNWDKINKNTWQIQTGGAGEIVVRYNVYANELTVRTNELNDEHAFFTPAALLMHPKNQIKAPSTVRVVPFGDWKVATGLPAVAGQQNVFRASDFDVLYDSPFEVSNFREISFTALGKPHRYVVTGEGNYDLQRLSRDTQKIVETTAAIFGNELPYENYLFIVNLRGGGGLEHLNSTALQFPRFAFTQNYNGFLNLVAHEFFHLWNVKRIRPDALGPFDYENENYTKNLWVAEGGTDFYADQILLRAGIISDREYVADIANKIAALQRTPGRFQTSVEEASFDAWIKNYRPDENTINREISYYSKGDLVMLLLDLTIRQRTGGARSMDDVMRALYNNFYKQNRNYTPQDFQRTTETVAGGSLDDFFRRYVRGREEINYNQIFEPIGLRLETAAPGAGQAYLGANLRQQGDFLIVNTLPAGTPAYEGGLNAGDQILAINNVKISNQNDLNARLAERKPGERVKFTLFRFDRLREIEITLGARPADVYRLAPVASPSAEQQRLYQGWVGAGAR